MFDQRCPVCGGTRDVNRNTGVMAPCSTCAGCLRRAMAVPAPPGVDECGSLLEYEGVARRLVAGLKYRNDRRTLTWLATQMANLIAPPRGCVVTWAPTTSGRRRQRGFDQAELLARAIARRWRVPCRGLLIRPSQPPQTGRSRRQRHEADVSPSWRGRRVSQPVVVVDDVITTGATLSHAAQVLRTAGAPWVGAVTAARTP